MRINVGYFQKQKASGIPITMLTAYDATTARLAEQAGLQTLLVGDSLGMVMQGHETTIPVTLDEMLYHTKMVVRGTEKVFVIGDMPFMTYNISSDQALQNAARFIQEAGAQSVKLEGGLRMASTIRRLVENGIPVLAHIGLTPQSVHRFGGWRVQGKTSESAMHLIEDAEAVQEAGAYAVVLELVPSELAKLISERLTIPTIGIGAGAGCDGQVQVFHDIIGLLADSPKHSRQYAQVGQIIQGAISNYKSDVENHRFPTEANAFTMDEEALQGLYGTVNAGLPDSQ
ncbi:MAG: 3-methyl-2-oxobutanoate hydroxymethyltransferase [Anaerolineae bacterium]|jgi:3-methyl-2-oxobutanoate hydroxymethyltransferase|nr:MAG: 3-methyl-2-oxobutanoate hydroxymethyltransferase [Anaerolineae bacterium]